MAKHILRFATQSDYDTKRSSDYIEPWVSYIDATSGVNFNKTEEEKDRELVMQPFTFEIISGEYISFCTNNSANRKVIEYSKDNGVTWISKTADTTTAGTGKITVTAGDTVMLRGDNPTGLSSGYQYCYFAVASNNPCTCNVKGNIMSLLYKNDFSGRTSFAEGATRCFYNLFDNTLSVIDASKLVLPATTLVEYCYGNMFYSNPTLTTPPKILPATTLANSCYSSMFRSCTALTSAPELPATTLANYCYSQMFWDCTSLETAPELPATTLANYCYDSMFRGCSITTAPELPATTLANSCYSSMFYSCTTLTSAPELPAETLAASCYTSMFQQCTSLETAPELPAETLVNYCYRQMFDKCTNLNYIKCLATNKSASYCLENWVRDVQTTTGTFVKNSSATWTTGNSGIPNGWTVEDA